MEEEPSAKPKRRSRRGWKIVGLLFVLASCLLPTVALLLVDQTAAEGVLYLAAVQHGSQWSAESLGDHYSANKSWHERFFAQDVARDIEWLRGTDIEDVQTSREQTLSGQWVTIVSFRWRQDPSDAWQAGALRVKTDNWMLLNYITAVEVLQP